MARETDPDCRPRHIDCYKLQSSRCESASSDINVAEAEDEADDEADDSALDDADDEDH